MSETLKQPKNYDNKLEVSFHDFLLQKAEKYGLNEPKKSLGAKSMSDTSKAEENVKSLVSDFYTNVEEKNRALDVGCGFGSALIALQQHFEQVCGIEIYNE